MRIASPDTRTQQDPQPDPRPSVRLAPCTIGTAPWSFATDLQAELARTIDEITCLGRTMVAARQALDRARARQALIEALLKHELAPKEEAPHVLDEASEVPPRPFP